jgi:hypothetical protein
MCPAGVSHSFKWTALARNKSYPNCLKPPLLISEKLALATGLINKQRPPHSSMLCSNVLILKDGVLALALYSFMKHVL